MVLEVLKLFWPFIREICLGSEVTIGQTVQKKQWKRLVLLVVITCSLLLNVYLVPRTIELSTRIINLQKKVKTLEVPSVPDKPEPSTPVIVSDHQEVESEAEKHKAVPADDSYDELVSRMRALK